MTKSFLRLLVLACALATLAVAPSPALAKTAPCWTVLLHDWADGHIDQIYPIHCYHDALKHLPADISTYSSARSDIERALQQAITSKKPAYSKLPETTTTTETTTLPNGTKHVRKVVTTVAPGKKKQKGIIGAFGRLDPSSPNSFPLPLIILGGLAILLVLAGVGGMLYRRYGGGAPPPAAP